MDYDISSRNKHFKDILKYRNKNNIDVAVAIIEKDLSEEEAYGLECTYMIISSTGVLICLIRRGAEMVVILYQ